MRLKRSYITGMLKLTKKADYGLIAVKHLAELGPNGSCSAKDIAEAYPAAEDLDIVLIGDAARIREAAAKFGRVTTMPLAAADFSPAADAR